jgi:hypothetical protein
VSEVDYDKITERARSVLPKGNKLKENFYTDKSIIKPFGLQYQKINMCLIFYMLYYFKNANLTEYITYGHAWYKPRTGRSRTFVS